VIDDRQIGDLHALPSGTVLGINTVLIRLTVHCEPCGRLAHYVRKPQSIGHRRGYLGTFLSTGELHLGDHVRSLGKRWESVPYDPRERIAWYLRRHSAPIPVKQLVQNIGLPLSYCRAIPSLTRGLADAGMIIFGS
jgi:MOSC domain-containing protein YiiM